MSVSSRDTTDHWDQLVSHHLLSIFERSNQVSSTAFTNKLCLFLCIKFCCFLPLAYNLKSSRSLHFKSAMGLCAIIHLYQENASNNKKLHCPWKNSFLFALSTTTKNFRYHNYSKKSKCTEWNGSNRKCFTKDVNFLSSLWENSIRGTQRKYSSKPLKHSIVKRILVFKR